jgi:2-C-methyl-D-erythritol 2,4-cyclodiphosphate synthase
LKINMYDFRIGQGYDVHKLVLDRDLYLCGVKIPHSLGLLGHSDADVALHALCDALLGAASLGDIGRHFPDSDPKYKGISSILLLENVVKKLNEDRWKTVNADITIIAQKPKLLPYIEDMRKNVAHALLIDISRVNVKATTTEKLGFEGREEGIAASAVVLIER